MDIKRTIHGLTRRMLTNLGRELVAIDSQLGTFPQRKPFGEGPAKALEGLRLHRSLDLDSQIRTITVVTEMGEVIGCWYCRFALDIIAWQAAD